MIQKIKNSNAGFTLVELIVVIAILGVLAAVLVPQYVQYVDRGRQASDQSSAGALLNAVQIALADPTITNITFTGGTHTVVMNGTNTTITGITNLDAALTPIVANWATTHTTSTATGHTVYTIVVNTTNRTATGSWTA